MARKLTKKAVIRQYVERESPEQIDRAAALAIRREAIAALGPGTRLTDEYLMSVLDELHVPVARDLRGVSPDVFAMLHASTLGAAEATLRSLDDLYRVAVEADAREAVQECRRAAMIVRDRAARMARNTRVAADKRAVREEVHRWFSIWLQTPGAFWEWLEVRRQTPEYREKFGPAEPQS